MTWIFSRAIVTEVVPDYENYTSSLVRVEASSLGNFSATAVSAPSSENPTPRPCLWHAKTTARFPLSRFGMTCEPFEESRGAELLTSWLAAFPARTSALPELVTDLTVSAPASGAKWRGSFAKYDRSASTWKTHQCSLLGDWDEFSETWPRWGLMRSGESFLRPMSALPTFESESGSSLIYPTPCAVDTGSFFNRSDSPNAAIRPTLGAMDLWPTPTVCGNYNRKGASSKSGDGLATAVKFRTPNASDGFKWSNQTQAEREAKGQQVRLGHQLGAGGLLNPDWVEWLMGWPIGHTALKPLETAKFQEWRQQHGAS